MRYKIQWNVLFLCLAIPLAVGGLSALLTRNSMMLYETIVQPPLSPPAWLFPIVWTLLYLLMGVSTYRIAISYSKYKSDALIIYGIQLALNFIWPLIFFLGKKYLIAFIVLILLWYIVLKMIQVFLEIDTLAAKLQLPYLIWLTFAGYLNLMIYFLNR